MDLDILKLVYDYSSNGKIFDRRYIEKLIEIVITSKSLNPYVRKIVWEKEIEQVDCGFVSACYNYADKQLEISISNLEMAIIMKIANSLFEGLEQVFYRNLMCAQTILHELEHVNQYKTKDLNGDDLETKLLSASLVMSRWLYQEYYEQNPCERLAEIKSYKMMAQILRQLKDNYPKLIEVTDSALAEQMLRGYNRKQGPIQCPTEIFLLETGNRGIWEKFDFYDLSPDKIQERVSMKYNLSERLTYGLPINSVEYDQTSEKADGLLKMLCAR